MSNGEFASDLKVTREDLDEFNELEPIQEPITYYSESYDVFGLVSRLERGDIVIPRVGSSIHNIEVNPFQRGFVWKRSQMDKFIESLLLGYPTPSLFFVYQRSDRRLVVLDGQQRLTTLFYYKTGLYKDKKYRLNLSESPFDKLSYDELPEGYQRYLNNSHLSATVIRVEETPRSKEAVYNVFARLNSGGTQLTAHEIRMALYNGPFMELIDKLNKESDWRSIYGTPLSARYRDHELILRILALYSDLPNYKKPLIHFLNDFADKHREDTKNSFSHEVALFQQSSRLLASCDVSLVFSTSNRKQINAARADSLMVGIMDCLDNEIRVTSPSIRNAIGELDATPAYTRAITKATSDESQVQSRIKLVIEKLKNAHE